MLDDAIVGAGIVGLAHAYELARRGRKVGVFERTPRAQGASVRNFGMIWPIGQPFGPRRQLAERSRTLWLELLHESRLWHEQVGSLHLAYHEDEAAVLEEFAALSHEHGFAVELLSRDTIRSVSPRVNRRGLNLGLYSRFELCVDPREVVRTLPAWLANRFGVEFHFERRVIAIDLPTIHAGGERFQASRVWICSGDELDGLFPEVLSTLGLVRTKLQMMRSTPLAVSERLGPMLAGGLTLRHYESFRACSSQAGLKARIARESPLLDRYGIHVMVSQNGQGELTIGDSHEYGDEIDLFDQAAIERMIREYLEGFLVYPELEIASRWHGTYARHPSRPYVTARPAQGVVAVTGFGGAGMTLSLAAASEVIAGELGDS